MLCKLGDSEPILGLLEGYVCWQHPYRNTRIYVHPQVVRSLSSHALECAKRGLEIGGALWGKAGPENSLVICDATLVQSSGLFFNATATDVRNLEQKLAGPAPKASLSLAGYFRSTIREGLSLTPQDQLLIWHCVRDPETVFVVIKPGASGVCTAGLTFWQNGFLQTDASYLEIPFVSVDEPPTPAKGPVHRNGIPKSEEKVRSVEEQWAEFASEEEPSIVAAVREWTPRSSLLPDPLPPAAPRDHDAKPAPPDEAIQRRTGDLLWLGLASLCLIAVITAAGVFLGLPLTHARPQNTPESRPRHGLELRAVPAAGGQLSLNWNRNAPEVVNAPGALLTIADGRRLTKLRLDNAQLRSGNLMYFPKSGDVQFRLELRTDELHTSAESVRVLSSDEDSAEAKPVRQLERSSHVRASSPGEWSVSAEVLSSRVDTGDNFSNPPEANNLTPPSIPLPPLQLPPLVSVTASAVRSQSPPTTYVPPQVVEEMMPETTPLRRVARIAVEVSIDQTGRVTAAHALNDGGTDDRELAAIATAAAQRWRFQPATLNGKPVPAEYKIVFAFHREIPQ